MNIQRLIKIGTIASLASLAVAAPFSLAQTLLIKDAKVITLSDQGTLQMGDLLVKDGRIAQIAEDLGNVTADLVIDGRGKVVTPGIIVPSSELGLTEIGAAASTNDSAIQDTSIGTGFNPVVAFNPHSTLIPFNRAGGITRAVVVPSSEEKIFAGQGFAIKLTGDYDSVIDKALVQRVYFGEYGAELAGGSRALAYAQIESALRQAKEYSENRDAIRRGEWRDLDFSIPDLEALQPLLSGEQPVLIRANRASDILQLLSLAKQFNLDLIVEGAAEGWMVAEQLAAARVPVVIDAMGNTPDAFEKLGARLDNAALLHKAGVTVVIGGPGYAGTHNSYLSRQGAGNAVAYGLPFEEGVRAITVNVASVFGLEGGVLAPGGVADLVLWSGDPLEVTSFAELVVIDGEPQSLENRSTRLRDRYLHPKPGTGHGYKK
ncbi:amidohydrolase family protein [Microbulbifer hydrolyticus]|uniref:Amidohydrolase family protein n=1 Tax=Microbulbifer hydrolyticus TaxID=48074 RepID=A0A6P1T912_9GAMM|nr:amidohydrolase family protein [Microbulbifer hydrolyticus]MBB5210197.1 imidazolonepropionase-like amidohydrolase [Microbulbifer hydrolyticus]QHQ39294.1 amidohydrolase family protein [Microbulbifer hydrolyticus]